MARREIAFFPETATHEARAFRERLVSASEAAERCRNAPPHVNGDGYFGASTGGSVRSGVVTSEAVAAAAFSHLFAA